MIQYYINVKGESKNKTYTEEFKRTIVELYETGNKTKFELTREYGTSECNVRIYKTKDGKTSYLKCKDRRIKKDKCINDKSIKCDILEQIILDELNKQSDISIIV